MAEPLTKQELRLFHMYTEAETQLAGLRDELDQQRIRAEAAEAERDRLDIGVNTLEYRVNKARQFAEHCKGSANTAYAKAGRELLDILDGEVPDDDQP